MPAPLRWLLYQLWPPRPRSGGVSASITCYGTPDDPDPAETPALRVAA